ncbi:MAG: NAD(P)-dependent oxidoreductase [Pseudomonadota bacterium]
MTTGASTVGVIGLGQMGKGIAANLAQNGLLNAVFDLDAGTGRHQGLGPFWQENVAPVLARCEICLFAVPSTAEVRETTMRATAVPGQLIVDLTTSHPNEARALARELEARGQRYVDAAMTGGAAGADAGTLTLMVGGEDADVSRLNATFNAIAARFFHLGPVGAGQAMKLVHNMILHANFLATCEGLGLARRLGIDLNQAADVLNAGNARSFVTEVRFPRDILSGTMNGRSTVANLAKDLGLASNLAATSEVPAPYADMTAALLKRAAEIGPSDRDFTQIFSDYASIAADWEAT